MPLFSLLFDFLFSLPLDRLPFFISFLLFPFSITPLRSGLPPALVSACIFSGKGKDRFFVGYGHDLFFTTTRLIYHPLRYRVISFPI